MVWSFQTHKGRLHELRFGQLPAVEFGGPSSSLSSSKSGSFTGPCRCIALLGSMLSPVVGSFARDFEKNIDDRFVWVFLSKWAARWFRRGFNSESFPNF